MATRMQALLPRTGQGAVEDAAAMPQVVALMQIFTADACRVAAAYAFARGRDEVVGEDMRKALMYTTRAFFDQEDSALLHRLDEELRAEHDTDTSDTSDTDTSDTGAIDTDAIDNTDTANTADSPPRDATPARQIANTVTRRALRATYGTVRDRTRDEVIARRVDDAVAEWDSWHPSDPVFRLLKRAVDRQSASDA